MSTPSLQIDLPGVNFEEMARTAIAAKLSEALIGADDITGKIVAAALTQKVNKSGVVDQRYSYENKTPYVEWLFQELIRGAVKDVLKQRIEEMRPALEKEIFSALKRDTKSLAAALTNSFVSSAKSGYALQTNIVVDVKLNRGD